MPGHRMPSSVARRGYPHGGRLSGRRAQLPAKRADERPAIYVGIVVGADQNRVVLWRVEREGSYETGVAHQFDALDDVEPHADPVAVVAEARLGREGRPWCPARQLLETLGVEDPLRPESA